MKKHLILKLLAVQLAVIGFVMVIVWLSIDTLAANYFVTLMEKYNISPEPAHHMFLSAVHRYLIWACLAGGIITALLSFALLRKVLTPLTRMTAISGEIAAGNFTVRVPVETADEVGRLAVAFNRMSESLDKITQLRRTLMIDVAHELRTPLTNIRGYLEALTDEVIPPSPETFTLLQDETLRLAQLVEDVLKLAKADSARGSLALEPVNLRSAVNTALEPFSRTLSEKQITVKLHVDEGLPEIQADRKQLARILRNLTDNAARYTLPHGTILISVNRFPGCVRVSYSNPCGDLIPEDLSFLFERFYRGEKSRSRQHGGAGIGLAIVKELVEAHGGHVGSALETDQIRIWFELPVSASPSKPS